jgi:hypothetical protein
LTQENLIKLVDYVINEPLEDSQKVGYKFPFNASEILCSENVFVIDKYFEDANRPIEEDEKEREEEKHTQENGEDEAVKEIANEISKLEIGDKNEEISKEISENKNIEINHENNEFSPIENNDHLVKDVSQASVDNKNKEEAPEEINTENKEETVKEIKPVVYPVIDHLFSSLNKEGPLNYVLAGYFYKIFNHLTNFRNNQMSHYLFFQRRNFIDDMLKHLNRKSICDCLVKIIVSYSADIQDQDFKKELLCKILANFNSKYAEVRIQ